VNAQWWRVVGVVVALALAVWWGYAAGKAEWGYVGYPAGPPERPPSGIWLVVALFAAGAVFGFPAVLVPFVGATVWYFVTRSGPECSAGYRATHNDACGTVILVLLFGPIGSVPVMAGVAARAGLRWFTKRKRRTRNPSGR
jgi:hypothetical protein